jgi:hypothetical protein
LIPQGVLFVQLGPVAMSPGQPMFPLDAPGDTEQFGGMEHIFLLLLFFYIKKKRKSDSFLAIKRSGRWRHF